MPSTRLSLKMPGSARLSRTGLFFAGIGLFDVLIWTAAAIAH